MIRSKVKHRSLILRVADAMGLTEAHGTQPSALPSDGAIDVQGFPEVSPGSAMALMMQMNPASVRTYADAVIGDLENCMSTFRVDGASVETVLECIHDLKNAIATIGSVQLIDACEAMRLDASRKMPPATLEARYRAVGNAAIHAVGSYMRKVTSTSGKSDP
jgi:hypothetical protein